TESAANTRFASGVQFDTVNAVSATVNGSDSTVTANVVTAANNAAAKTVGVHIYNVIVTSSTGHTADITVSYQVTADPATPGHGTLGVDTSLIQQIRSWGTVGGNFTNGWEWIIPITVPDNNNNVALKFANWTSGSNNLPVALNMQYYSEEIDAENTGSSAHPVSITAAGTYPDWISMDDDRDSTRDGIQTYIHVQVKIPADTVSGSYTTSFGVAVPD
ncbi:MAG: hypothetical protein WC113_03505, partial [Candidatus Paceibacterota bacterium]